MTTALTPKFYKAIAIALIILAIAAAHLFLVSILIELGKSASVSEQDNLWLNAAEIISWQNPDIYEAQGRYYRQQAFVVDKSINKQNTHQLLSLNSSHKYWQEAINASPLWPYYQLNALDVEVLLGKSSDVIQERLGTIIRLAPNERGLDKSLLEISFIVWSKLNKDQQKFMLSKLATARWGVLKRVYAQAKKAGNHHAICVNLPWNKVRRFCK